MQEVWLVVKRRGVPFMKWAESPEVSCLGQSDRRERHPRFIKQTLGKYSSPAGEVARSAGGGLYPSGQCIGALPRNNHAALRGASAAARPTGTLA